jgi:hypothetical protein
MSAAAGASASQSEMISRMSFMGLSHIATRDFVDLYAWDAAHKARFEARLENKLLRQARVHIFKEAPEVTAKVNAAKREHATDKKALQEYFKTHIKGIEEALHLKTVTEADDNILFIATKARDHFFVYFGAMSDSMVHIACWMVVPKTALGAPADRAHRPKICFWMLNTSYAQQMADLETGDKDIEELENVLDLSEGLEYPG